MNPKQYQAPATEVRVILAALGWAHGEAAEHLGVGRVTVARWATGARNPGEQVLRHLRLIAYLHTQPGGYDPNKVRR